MITARAPATSANLGSGYDTFGVALTEPFDTVHVERAEQTTIELAGDAGAVPTDPAANTAGVVAGELGVSARIRIEKGVRPASGMGSSAASAAAAALALDELYGLGHDRKSLIGVAAEGERVASGAAHRDNVTPALLGGFTIDRGDGATTVSSELSLVVCLPAVSVTTREARKAVPDAVSMPDHIETVGNAATVAVGFCRSDPALVGAGLDDPVVTPARAAFIDGYDGVRSAALAAGATGVTVSGAGPGVLAVVHPETSDAVATGMTEAFETAGIEAEAIQTTVGDGARLV